MGEVNFGRNEIEQLGAKLDSLDLTAEEQAVLSAAFDMAAQANRGAGASPSESLRAFARSAVQPVDVGQFTVVM